MFFFLKNDSIFYFVVVKYGCFVLQTDAGWEEYYDYIFPDDETANPNLKLSAITRRWKMQQESTETGNGGDGDNRDEGADDEDKDIDESEDPREGNEQVIVGNGNEDENERKV